MGRRRQLENALAQALAVGISLGRRRALEDALEVTARKLFEDEAEMVLALLDEGTPEQVLEALPKLREEVIEPRWRDTMRPLLADIIKAQVR